MSQTPLLDREALHQYYGKILQSSQDLKTNACCTRGDVLFPQAREALAAINDEVALRFYGCGSPLPSALEGMTILDLGCGTGRDAYVAARLAGPEGHVIGVDMTEEQLAVAQRNRSSQMARLELPEAMIEFRQGYIEDLEEAGIADESVDVVISNCVINLSPDKKTVFSEIFRVLKPGGELLFSDVFSGRRIPAALQQDPVLHGECLSGALYREDFRRLLAVLGYPDRRVVSSRLIELGDPAIEAIIGMVPFYSETVRVFKVPLEDRCEDYGQIAVYRGTIKECPHAFALDQDHAFLTHQPVRVCGNTAAMLGQSRYSRHFEVTGNENTHFGLFGANRGKAQAGPCC